MFTIVFSGNVDDYPWNPLQANTVFGRPKIVDRNNLADENDRLRAENERLRAALTKVRDIEKPHKYDGMGWRLTSEQQAEIADAALRSVSTAASRTMRMTPLSVCSRTPGAANCSRAPNARVGTPGGQRNHEIRGVIIIMTSKQKARPLAVGMTVWIGIPGITTPSDWALGRILWVGPDEVMCNVHGFDGQDFRAVYPADHVRAAAHTVEPMADYKNCAAEEVRSLNRRIHDIEVELHAAKAALYAALDRYAGRADL